MTGHANPQRLVDAAVGVRKLDVEYVDSVAECHTLVATGRYAGMPASRYSARCQGVRRCASRLSGRLNDTQIAKRRIAAVAWPHPTQAPVKHLRCKPWHSLE